jgi:hypothetical protein
MKDQEDVSTLEIKNSDQLEEEEKTTTDDQLAELYPIARRTIAYGTTRYSSC